MRVLVAPDSFKGTMGAAEVAEALARGLESRGCEAERCPLADGGEGTQAVLLAGLGGELREVEAHDPLGRAIAAPVALLADGRTAVVEVAAAAGLALLARGERDPLRTDTAGVGELIAAAARKAGVVLVAAGGSATNDGGAGALAAIAAAGGIGGAELVCLCDVRTPWERASAAFGPQKGADAAAVAQLEQRLERLAEELPRDPRGVAGTGAAGGLAGGLWAALGATLVPGAAYVADALGLDGRIARAELAVTGEGRLDATTLEGKVVAEVARRCAAAAVPLHAAVGDDASSQALREELRLLSVSVAESVPALERAGAALARLGRA